MFWKYGLLHVSPMTWANDPPDKHKIAQDNQTEKAKEHHVPSGTMFPAGIQAEPVERLQSYLVLRLLLDQLQFWHLLCHCDVM